jgi:hypothetical protein
MEKETVKKIILWTQEALHYGKITGSDDEIAERCMKDIEFDALCNPDIYEANANEHFENEEKIEIKCQSCEYFKIGYGNCNWCIHSGKDKCFQNNYKMI